MPDLSFEVIGAEVPAFAAIPILVFKLRIVNAHEQEAVHTVVLSCQLQIAATRRHYSAAAQAGLLEVFGEPGRWGETLHNLLWANTSVMVPQFSGNCVVDLTVPCTYDFEIVSAKYFAALDSGDIPLTFLFSGTVFYEDQEGNLRVAPIPWSKEASFSFPVALWQELMSRYYPNSAWIRLHKDVFEQLYRYKARHSLPTWEATFEQLLRASGEEAQV